MRGVNGLAALGLSFSGGSFSLQLFSLPTFCLLLLLYLGHLFNAFDIIGSPFSEAFEIDLFDKYGQGRLPWLLFVIGDLAEPLRVHAKFPCHLNMGMGKMILLSGINPCLVFLRGFCFLWHLVR